jgi:hypothetical protein
MSIRSDFFSNTNPDLISTKSINDLNEAVVISDTGTKMKTLVGSFEGIYKIYIKPNLIPIIILVVFLSFIIYRYMTNKQSSKEEFDPSKSINDKTQTKLELHETDNHHEFDHVINNHPEFDNVINNIIQKNEVDEILNDDSIYDMLYTPEKEKRLDDRIQYGGTKNNFKNQKTIKMEHPNGYDNDFIEMENQFLDYSTTQNKSKVDEASSMLFS